MRDQLYGEKSDGYYANPRHDVLSRIDITQFGRVLDLGGGNGATSRFLIDSGMADSSLIIDPYSTLDSGNGIEVMKEDLGSDGLFDKLQADGKQFDTVLLLDVAEHLTDPWSVVANARKVHKSGGSIVVSVPNARYVKVLMPLVLFGRFDYQTRGPMDRTHIRWFTRDTISELVQGAGYTVSSIVGKLPDKGKPLTSMTFGALRRFCEVQYIIHAKNVI